MYIRKVGICASFDQNVRTYHTWFLFHQAFASIVDMFLPSLLHIPPKEWTESQSEEDTLNSQLQKCINCCRHMMLKR